VGSQSTAGGNPPFGTPPAGPSVAHTRLAHYTDIASSVALLVSLSSAWYTRRAARAARDQAGASRDQAEAATRRPVSRQVPWLGLVRPLRRPDG
jgi:hypothetical protein